MPAPNASARAVKRNSEQTLASCQRVGLNLVEHQFGALTVSLAVGKSAKDKRVDLRLHRLEIGGQEAANHRLSRVGQLEVRPSDANQTIDQ